MMQSPALTQAVTARALQMIFKRQPRISSAVTWRDWLVDLFPSYVTAPFSDRHETFWEWVWSIRADERPRPLVSIWPRGGGKSTSAELAAACVSQRRTRRYLLYVCGTQEQADRHVSNIGVALEKIGVERAVNKYGSSRGWRRNRLHTADDFIVDALGLDTAARGIKTEERRPDFIILDDIDDRHDSPETAKKKRETITETILPAGSVDCAVLAIQNLVHSKSVFSGLANGSAGFLTDRILSGPFPALYDFAYTVEDNQFVITSGRPSWDGQDVTTCQNYMRTAGDISFKRECQHQLDDAEGALWKRAWITATRITQAPEGMRVIVAIDPSATSKATSDEAGVVAVGRLGTRGYALRDDSLRAPPHSIAVRAIAVYVILSAAGIVAEGNNGGEWIETVIRAVPKNDVVAELIKLGKESEWAEANAISGKQVVYSVVWASEGKTTRAEPASQLYQRGLIHHVGIFALLEDELCNWLPGRPSPNRLDALVWALTKLGLTQKAGVFVV